MSPVVLLRSLAVLVVLLVLQTSVAAEHPLFGAQIDLLLALAVAGGLAGGAQRGAVTGFFAGLALDLLVVTPFGLSALTYALVGYAVGSANGLRVRQSRTFPFLAGLVGGVLGVLGFAVLGELVGQPYLSTPELPTIVAVEAVGCAVLAGPLSAVLRWAWRSPFESRMVVV